MYPNQPMNIDPRYGHMAPGQVPYGAPPQPYGQPNYPTPAPQQAPAGMPPASNGGVPQMPGMSDARVGGGGPAIRELEGRAIIAMPTRIERGVPGVGQNAAPQDRVTMTVWILDGGPLVYGANVQPPSPPTHRLDTVPARIDGVLSSHANILRAVEGSFNTVTNQPTGVVLGRIVRGVTAKAGNSLPWNLQPLEPNDPARAIAAQVQQQVNAGTFTNPEPVDLAAQAAPQQQAVYPPAGPGHPVVQAMAQPQGPYAPQQQAPADQPPPNVPPALWATFTPEQKAAFGVSPAGPAAAW